MPANFDEQAFNADAASVVHGGIAVGTLAAKYMLDEPAALALIERNEADVNKLAAEMESDGRDICLIAQRTLGGALRQLAGEVEAGNLNHSMLLRTVEVLNKVSGLEARHKQVSEDRGTFIFKINFHEGESVSYGSAIDVEPVTVENDVMVGVREALNHE